MDINNNPILTEAKTNSSEYYVPLLMGFTGHVIGFYYGVIGRKNSIWVSLAIGVGSGAVGVALGSALMKSIKK